MNAVWFLMYIQCYVIRNSEGKYYSFYLKLNADSKFFGGLSFVFLSLVI